MAALEYMDAGPNMILASLSPLFVVALAPLFGERPGWSGVLGALLGLLGIVLLSGGAHVDAAMLPGVVMAVVAAACASLYMLLARHWDRGEDPLARTALAALIGAAPLAALADPLATAGALATGTWEVRAAALWCGVAGTGVTLGLWTLALQRLPASRVAPTLYVLPPLGLLSAWLLLGEVPGWHVIAGGLLILGGVALAQRPVRR
jgi:O-acetylserine/cysteine efflux transporter